MDRDICEQGDSRAGEGGDPETTPDGFIEDAAEGRHLYLDFVRTEIVRSGMEMEIECLDRAARDEDEMIGFHQIVDAQRLLDWTRAGQELRQLADAFSRSKERQTVRKRAQSVSVEHLDFNNFLRLLQELFQVSQKNTYKRLNKIMTNYPLIYQK